MAHTHTTSGRLDQCPDLNHFFTYETKSEHTCNVTINLSVHKESVFVHN